MHRLEKMDYLLRIEKEREYHLEVIKNLKFQKFLQEQINSDLNQRLKEGKYMDKAKFFNEEVEQLQREIRDLKGQTFEKDLIVSGLNEKLRKLIDEILEKDKNLGICEEKVMYFKEKMEKSEKYIQNLKDQSLEKTRINSMLDGKLKKLETEISEKDQLIVTYTEEMKCFQQKVRELEQQIQDLEGVKLAADQMVEKMRSQESKVDDEKNKIIIKLKEEICKLKNQSPEKDHDRMCKEEVMQLEGKIQDLMDEKLNTNKTINKMKCKHSNPNDDKNVIIRELNEKIAKLENEILDKDQAFGMYQKELIEKVELSENEVQSLKDRILSADGTIEKMKCKQLAADKIIEKMKQVQSKAIHDLDELSHRNLEIARIVAPTNEVGNIRYSNGKRSLGNRNVLKACTSTKRTSFVSPKTEIDEYAENLHQVGSSGYIQAEVADDDKEKVLKRLKMIDPVSKNHAENIPRSSCSTYTRQTLKEKEKTPSPNSSLRRRIPTDGVISDSDNESAITDILADIRCQKLCKMWVSVAEMRKEIDDNIEFCLNAPCVIYRHILSNPGELGQFDAMSGSKLAEYLMNGDLKHRLMKFVPDVELERPDDIVLCRELARIYCEKLFVIYHSGEDPLFRFK